MLTKKILPKTWSHEVCQTPRLHVAVTWFRGLGFRGLGFRGLGV